MNAPASLKKKKRTALKVKNNGLSVVGIILLEISAAHV